MNVRTDRSKTRAGLAAAAIAATVLAGTSACVGSSTSTAASSGTASSAGAGPSSAGTVTLPAPSSSAAAAAGATTTAAGAANAGNGIPDCANTDITVSLSGSDAAMNHAGQALKFTNVSAHTCTLHGYPGVAVVANGDGRTLVNATRALNGYIGDERQLSSAPVVTLQAGQSAGAVVEWVGDAGEQCYPNGSGTLLVTPPNTTKSTSLRTMLVGTSGVCAGFEVHPVVPGVLTR